MCGCVCGCVCVLSLASNAIGCPRAYLHRNKKHAIQTHTQTWHTHTCTHTDAQACGRAFVTSWNQQSQQWGTRELPQGHAQDGLPDLLPKIVEVIPACLLLSPTPPLPSSRYGRRCQDISLINNLCGRLRTSFKKDR